MTQMPTLVSNAERVRLLCNEIVAWQAPSGGIDHTRCTFHRETPFGKPSAFGQDLPWLARALYRAADALHVPAYKEAADRYAVYFIACMGENAPAFALGDAIDPCFVEYRAHNLHDDSFDGLYRDHSAIRSLFGWMVAHVTDEPHAINAGYFWVDDEGNHREGEDVAFSNDLSDVGRGLVAYATYFKDNKALEQAMRLARFFLAECVPGTTEGIWLPDLGTWAIGPRHTAGFENVEVHADEAGWVWTAYYAPLFLLRLHDALDTQRDEDLRSLIVSRCLQSYRWTFDACQFEDGALGMQGRDDKWLGMTALAILQSPELYRRGLVDDATHADIYPRLLHALSWLERMTTAGEMPADLYIPVTLQSRPWPGWNTSWQYGLVVEALLAAAEVRTFGASRG